MRAMLMLADREEISRGLAEGLQFKEIGLRLGRDCSVISRVVGRHGGRERYRAAAADTAACAGFPHAGRMADAGRSAAQDVRATTRDAAGTVRQNASSPNST